MKENKNKNKDRKEHGGDGCYSESMRAKCFCFAFKLRFLHLIYRVSLILKSNLELALSIILYRRELYWSKHLGVDCRCLKI